MSEPRTAGARADSPLATRMVFLVGARRSGTYWLQRMLAAHPAVSALPTESFLFSDGIAPLFARFQDSDPEGLEVGSIFVERSRAVDAARRFCDSILSPHLDPGTELLLERTPHHALHMELIAEIYPDARFVHIIRDGRDVARSITAQDWGADTIGGAAEEWRASVHAAREAGFGPERYREVRYEELLADPGAGIGALFEWLGLEGGENAIAAALEEAGRQVNLDASAPSVGAGKWRESFSEADLEAFGSVAGDLLEELGYERSALAPGRPRPGRGGDPPALIASRSVWYHTLDLGGIETPGFFDLRPIVERMPWPDVRGKRCLDVGPYDGFLAFELERRGAREVVAADISDPAGWDFAPATRERDVEMTRKIAGAAPGGGFEIARELLGSRVRRVEVSAYDLSPESVGEFEVVVCGSLLLHLQNPVRALAAIHSVCREAFLSAEQISPALTLLGRRRPLSQFRGGDRAQWWIPNVAAHAKLLAAAGFEVERSSEPYAIPLGKGHPHAGQKLGSAASRALTRIVCGGQGVPHVAVLARPVQRRRS